MKSRFANCVLMTAFIAALCFSTIAVAGEAPTFPAIGKAAENVSTDVPVLSVPPTDAPEPPKTPPADPEKQTRDNQTRYSYPYIIKKDCMFTLYTSTGQSASSGTGTSTIQYNNYYVLIQNCQIVQNPSNIPVYDQSAPNLVLYQAVTVTPNPVVQNQALDVWLNVINNGSTAFTGTITAQIYTASNSLIQEIETKTLTSLAPTYYYTNGLTFHSSSITASPGTYYVWFLYKPANDIGYWLKDSSSNYVTKQITVQAPSAYNIALYSAITVTPNPIIRNQAVDVTANIANLGNGAFKGTFCAALFDSSKKFVGYVETESASLSSTWYNTFTFHLNAVTYAAGNYYIYLFYKPDGGNWVQMPSGSYTHPVSVSIQEPSVSNLALYAPITVTPNPIIRNQTLQVKTQLINNGNTTFTGSLGAFLRDSLGYYYDIQYYEVNGTYSLPAGSYYGSNYFTLNSVTYDPGSYTIEIWYAPTGGTWIKAANGSYNNSVSVSIQENQPQTISGYVRDSANAAISGVTLTFSNSGGTATTDSSGSYSKTVSYNWSGTVTPSKSGYTFNPANRSYSGVISAQSNQNYTAISMAQPNIVVSPKSLVINQSSSARSTREDTGSGNTQESDSSAQNTDIQYSSSQTNTYATGAIISDEILEYWKTHTPPKVLKDNLPASKDWSMYDTPIKNQATCGSCWAMAAVALVENLGKQTGLSEQDLSEQVIVSCVGNGTGCGGGSSDQALKYIKDKGLPPEDCYRFSATNGNCNSKCQTPRFLEKVSQVEINVTNGSPTVDQLRSALQKGPFVVYLDAYSDFGDYRGGIYKYRSGICNQCGHLVLLVGYNDSERYFRIKNSWGTSWGEQGYGRISYDNVGGITKFGSYGVTASGVYIQNNQAATTFTITNTGTANLTLSLSKDKSWLSVSPQTISPIPPNGQQIITVSVTNWSLLQSMRDTATVTISSNDPDEPRVAVNIEAAMLAGASMSSLSVSLPYQQLGNVSKDGGILTLSVLNMGGGTMNWTAASDNSWLKIIMSDSDGKMTGSGDGTVAVSCDPNTGDKRIGTITVTADGVANSPQTIEITQDGTSGSSTTPGDLDCDTFVTLSDAILGLRIMSSIDPQTPFCLGDVNGDNRIGLEEVVYILQKVAGLR